MSDLNPKGVPITLNDGVERHFLFTLRIYDMIQDRYKEPVFDVIMRLGDSKRNARALIELTAILANDEVEMKEHFNGSTEIPRITEKDVQWLVDIDNMGEVSTAILNAFGISSPEPDEKEEEDPNQETVQQK